MSRFYLKSVDDVLNDINSGETGLTSSEAAKRLEENGKNKLAEAKKESLVSKFFKSLMDPMIIMLLAAAAISLVTAVLSNESFADVFIILFVVVLNTVLSLVQESKAEQAIDALKQMTAATCKVMRDGEMQIIKAEDLVVGDVVILEAGDSVPADCRVLESHSMKVEEAALTGESLPVTKMVDLLMLGESQKDVSLGDRKNMLYSGSTVVYGRGRAVVTATGMDTEMGKIADALAQASDETTPLQKKIAELSGILTKLVIGICVVVFVAGIIRSGSLSGAVLLDTFMVAVALAVAAIPEGMPAVVTIVLSIGVTAMSKRNALIRKLTAVETLGCTQIICSDKTGTLTQNKMTVVDEYSDDKELLAKGMALCSDAEIKPGETEAIGEPTECALVNYANTLGMPKYELAAAAPRLGEAPFDSGRKMMSTVHSENGSIIQYTKGACEVMLDLCSGILQGGSVVPITEDIKNDIKAKNKEFADRALRVLGCAFRKWESEPENYEASYLEQDLVFIGFVGMIDPCRPEVYEAIAQCRKAGIRPVMITGDHLDTAVAIAKDLGIITDASQATLGAALEDMDDDQLYEAVAKYSVYARVQPEHKTRIVKAWQAHGMVTAMTGDGVNDAPSIKAADIGIGMGITGTDVTKGVCDMVLADDNFATIVNAVEEGRKIYDNVRKVIQFQVTTNIAEVIAVFSSSLLGVTILQPAHLLWINMVTDSMPGLALGMEKAEGDLMNREPRPSDESLFARGAGLNMGLQGVFMGLLILASYFVGQFVENGHIGLFPCDAGVTMAFLTTNFVEIFRAFCMRSINGSIFTMKSRNKWLWLAFAWTVILTIGVVFIPPIANLFGFASITIVELLVAVGLALTIIPVVEIIKLVRRKTGHLE